jgi:hypothetical protein
MRCKESEPQRNMNRGCVEGRWNHPENLVFIPRVRNTLLRNCKQGKATTCRIKSQWLPSPKDPPPAAASPTYHTTALTGSVLCPDTPMGYHHSSYAASASKVSPLYSAFSLSSTPKQASPTSLSLPFHSHRWTSAVCPPLSA